MNKRPLKPVVKVLSTKLTTLLFFLPIILSIIGLFFVFEASSIRSFQETGDSFRYFKLQAVWLSIGICAMVFFSFFDYHKLYVLSSILMGGSILLLFLVLIPGIGHAAGGARRWIDLGFFSLQPSELAKFSTIIYLSSWFVYKERYRFLSFLMLLGILMALIFLQPDMGTAIIIFAMSIVIYYLAGNKIIYLASFLPLALAAFFVLIKVAPYRLNRLLSFFDPQSDPLGISYHINQILISLSNGGIMGQGFGASRQKYLFLPEAHTDSIFAIVGEEIGFVGSFILLCAFIFFIYQLYKTTQNAPDRLGKLLGGGIFTFFSLQIIINLCAMVNLIPLTGVPLPFFSYGGSHMITSFMLMGIVINIAKKSKVA